ncbi:MAG: carboxypeptidase regulatory-like domain-containing protein [Cyclobacteriaceae bacterium]
MKYTSTLRLNTLLASFLCLFLPTHGQEIKIYGKIVDAATSLPIDQASVFLTHLPVESTSDSTGRFTLTNVPVGEFELRVTRKGYLPYRRFSKSEVGTYQTVIKLSADTLSKRHDRAGESTGLQSLRERIYICTDKPYYYPGEIIWFAGYFNYSDRTKKDSLSRVAYVDLLNSKGKVITKKILPVDNGLINGNVRLPDDLSPGPYFIRSYTTWMLNFADEDIFYKPIPILDLFTSVDIDAASPRMASTDTVNGAEEKIALESDKSVYSRRERINLSVSFTNPQWTKKSGFFSISVTDEQQVVPIAESNILQQFNLKPGSLISPGGAMQFPVESGISFIGQFKKDFGKPKKVMVSLVLNEFEDFFVAETDDNGKFFVNGLDFYDSAIFYYWANDSHKERARAVPGKLEIAIPPEAQAPALFPGFWFKAINEKSVQRNLDYSLLPKDATILKEVVIQSSRREPFNRGEDLRIGSPDYVLEADQLNPAMPNILMSLQGKVPGLMITCNGFDCTVRFNRNISLTPGNNGEPLVLIDGMPVSGEAGEVLRMINPFDVYKVEVKRRNSYRSDGGNGIIAIYTKQAFAPDGDLQRTRQFFSLKGYTSNLTFLSPDHGESIQAATPDYRSTLYWNPRVEINELMPTANISFFAADLSTQYRVVVDGITSDGEPVRVEKYITIR